MGRARRQSNRKRAENEGSGGGAGTDRAWRAEKQPQTQQADNLKDLLVEEKRQEGRKTMATRPLTEHHRSYTKGEDERGWRGEWGCSGSILKGAFGWGGFTLTTTRTTTQCNRISAQRGNSAFEGYLKNWMLNKEQSLWLSRDAIERKKSTLDQKWGLNKGERC